MLNKRDYLQEYHNIKNQNPNIARRGKRGGDGKSIKKKVCKIWGEFYFL